ncbi:MAG: hypothetical protein V4574_09485 [Pseudomonadota bacterium]
MKKHIVALVYAVTLSACSGQSADTLPPFAAIEKATLDYANCVDQAARKPVSRPSQVNDLARRAVAACRALRTKALALKSVPVFFPTVAEFDSTHLDVARSAVESAGREGNGARAR